MLKLLLHTLVLWVGSQLCLKLLLPFPEVLFIVRKIKQSKLGVRIGGISSISGLDECSGDRVLKQRWVEDAEAELLIEGVVEEAKMLGVKLPLDGSCKQEPIAGVVDVQRVDTKRVQVLSVGVLVDVTGSGLVVMK